MAVQQQMAIHQEDDVTLSLLPTHNYKLIRSTTKQRERISLAVTDESTGHGSLPKGACPCNADLNEHSGRITNLW